MQGEQVVKHKICEDCGKTFFHDASHAEKYCPAHRKLTVLTRSDVPRETWKPKEMAWKELKLYL